MILFVICLVVALIGLAVAIGGRLLINPDDRYSDGPSRGVVVGVGLAIVALAAIVTVFNSFTTIPVRTVGIELSFGKPVGLLNNGIHWVAPWHNIDKEWDGSVQTQRLTVKVRLANQTTADTDVTVQWNIHPNADVLELYRQYKTFDNVRTNLVERQLQHALNIQFAKFDPLRTINTAQAGDGAATAGASTGPTIDQLAAAARTDLQAAVGDAIQVGTLTIPIVHFDGTTEDRLRQFQQALADTRIAEQRKQTAQKVADANNILAASQATQNAGVQYQNCLNLVADLAAKGQLKDLPPTFNCGGSSGTPVIVGQK